MRTSVANPLLLIALTTAALQSSILYLLFHRKLLREVPLFTAYTGVQIIAVPATIAAFKYTSHVTYFYVYCAAEGVTLALGLLIIYEIFALLFRSYEGIAKVTGWLFTATAVTIAFVSLMLALHSNRPGLGLIITMNIVERSLRFIQAGLLIVLFALSRYLQLRWRHYAFGIALGFGLYAIIDLVVSQVLIRFWVASLWTITLVPPLGYLVTVSLWFVYMLQKQPAAQPIKGVPPHELEKWNETLLELLTR